MANITTVPSGWQYIRGTTHYTAGQKIPSPQSGDIMYNTAGSTNTYTLYYQFQTSITIGDVVYTNCWVCYIHKPYNTTIPTSLDLSAVSQIKGNQVVAISTYNSTVSNYAQLKTITGFPEGVKRITLYNCQNIENIPPIPSSVRLLYTRNTKISSLELSEGLEKVNSRDCPNLTSVNYIPSTVTDLNVAFQNCTALTGRIRIDANPSIITNCLQGTTQHIVLYGNSTMLSQIQATATNGNVDIGKVGGDYLCYFHQTRGSVEAYDNKATYSQIPTRQEIATLLGTTINDVSLNGCFKNCTLMTESPDVYNCVDTSEMFKGCTSLTGEIVINHNGTYTNMFQGTSQEILIHGESQHLPEMCLTSPLGNVHIGGVVGDFKCVYDDGVTQITAEDKTKTSYAIPTLSEVEELIGRETEISLKQAFKNCVNMTRSPVLPDSVSYEETFYGCTSLGGGIEINSSPADYDDCFYNTVETILINGDSAILEQLAYTANNENVLVGDMPEWITPVYNRTSPNSRTNANDMTRIAGNAFLAGASLRKLEYHENDIVTKTEWTKIVNFCKAIDETITESTRYDNLNKIEQALDDVYHMSNKVQVR